MIREKYKSKLLAIVDDLKSSDLPLCFTPTKASKLTYKNPNAFSLPAGITCPGKTGACIKCYAQKGNHIYPSVMKAYARNLRLFDHYRAKDDLQGCKDKLLEIVPASGNFRIHESGDFQDQFSVDVWVSVIKSVPNTIFWAYTRSFHLDFKKITKLKNFHLLASSDQYNHKQAKAFARKHKAKLAYGPWSKDENIPDNAFICPATGNGKLKGIKGACQKCRLCLSDRTSKDVVFLSH